MLSIDTDRRLDFGLTRFTSFARDWREIGAQSVVRPQFQYGL
jgi:hypothetical protein